MSRGAKTGKPYPNVRPADKSLKKIKARLTELTGRNLTPIPLRDIVGNVNRSLRGWANYFHYRNSSLAMSKVRYHAEDRLRTHLMKRHQGEGPRNWFPPVSKCSSLRALRAVQSSYEGGLELGACRGVKSIGKPCAGKSHARFDEGGQAKACPLLYPWGLLFRLGRLFPYLPGFRLPFIRFYWVALAWRILVHLRVAGSLPRGLARGRARAVVRVLVQPIMSLFDVVQQTLRHLQQSLRRQHLQPLVVHLQKVVLAQVHRVGSSLRYA
jgi:hypothetical protein